MCGITWDVCISVWNVPDLRVCVHEYSHRMHANPWSKKGPSLLLTRQPSYATDEKKKKKDLSCRKAITCDIPKKVDASPTPTNFHENSNVGL